MLLTRKSDRGSGFHRHPRTLVRFLTPTLHLCISFLLRVFAFLLLLPTSCLSPSAQPFFCPFLFSWDKYLYQVSGVLLLGEAQGSGNVLEIHFSNPLLTRRLEDCCWEFNLWLRFPSSRCSSAVTCDCISPLQCSAGLIIVPRVSFANISGLSKTVGDSRVLWWDLMLSNRGRFTAAAETE